MKSAAFLGDSLDCIRRFPAGPRSEAGHQIRRVQSGKDPDDWKPLKTIGAGVREIRIQEASGAFRVIYLATAAEVIVVLHAFQKKTRTTARRDIELAESRLRAWKAL